MRHDSDASPRTFVLSAALGSSGGVALTLLLGSLSEPVEPRELWAVPVLILVYGSFALPFVMAGLAIFGLPVAALLRPYWDQPWLGIVAMVWGALAGKLMWLAVDRLLFFSAYEFMQITLSDPGILYGVPSAAAWWLLRRKEIAARA